MTGNTITSRAFISDLHFNTGCEAIQKRHRVFCGLRAGESLTCINKDPSKGAGFAVDLQIVLLDRKKIREGRVMAIKEILLPLVTGLAFHAQRDDAVNQPRSLYL
jgi:hypothetical protein